MNINYPRYFPLGLDIQLERVFLDPAQHNRTDRLFGQIASCRDEEIIAHFPYGTKQTQNAYPFFPGMPFVIHADYHGLGVRAAVTFEAQLASSLILLKPSDNLSFYYKKNRQPFALDLWHGCLRENGSLLKMLRQWRRHVDRFQVEGDPSAITRFVKWSVKLGEDSINLDLQAPVRISELALVYLALDDKKPLICILAEVVSAEAPDATGRQQSELHFINILQEDRLRIERLLRDRRKQAATQENPAQG